MVAAATEMVETAATRAGARVRCYSGNHSLTLMAPIGAAAGTERCPIRARFTAQTHHIFFAFFAFFAPLRDKFRPPLSAKAPPAFTWRTAETQMISRKGA